MNGFISDVAFTPSVKTEQGKRGSRSGYQKMVEKRDWQDTISDDLNSFIAEIVSCQTACWFFEY